MNRLEEAYNEINTIGEYSKKYYSYLMEVLSSIDDKELNKLEELFLKSNQGGNTIFVAGNGGSAATATTFANDIGFDILKKTKIKKPFKIFSLVDNNSVITAISNDVGYENIFLNQLRIHYRDGDNLIVISASGNSPNVVEAAKWVKSKGGKIISFLGFSGGELLKISDIKIHVKSNPGEYGPVEDAHLIVNHILAHWFQNKFK